MNTVGERCERNDQEPRTVARDAESKTNEKTKILRGEEVPFSPEWTSLGQFVLDKLEASDDFVGQLDVVTGETQTYGTIRQRSVRCALWMRSRGLRPGDVVTVCAANHLDTPIPCFAALYLAAAFHPLDTSMTATEVLHLLNIARPKFAFVDAESLETFVRASRKSDVEKLRVVVFGRVSGFFCFEDIVAEASAEEVEGFSCTPVGSLRETTVVMCSSGTSGLPKAVELSNETILRQLSGSEINMSGNNCLVFSGLYWISGTLCMFVNLSSRVTRLIAPPFEEYSACEIVKEREITWILLGSSMINRLLKSGALTKHRDDLRSLKRVCYGGSMLSQSSRKALAELLPHAELTAAYGLTEIGGLLSIQTADSKPESCGKLLDNARLKIVDPETGRALGPNEDGEILVQTPCLMNRYCGNPQATAEAVDEEGWLHTGDLGHYDDDEELFVVGRLKELIKYRAHQVSPFEVESLLLSHPGVREAAVVGLPHPVDDEHPIAFVVKAAGKNVTELDLVNFVARELSDSKRLRGGVRFLDRLPKSPSDKVRRNNLRVLAARSLE